MPPSESQSEDPFEARPGHLSKAWEIGVAIAIVAVVLLLVGATIFSYRRNQRRKREQAEEQAAAEAGRARSYEKKSSRTSKRESTFDERGSGSRSSDNVLKPPRAASVSNESRRSSKHSYPEHPSQKPPKYYWSER